MNEIPEAPLQKSPTTLLRRVSNHRQSVTSWVSHLAHVSFTSPMPSAASPATSEKTITRKASQIAIPSTRQQELPTTLDEHVQEVGEEAESETRTILMLEADAEGKYEDILSPLDEVAEQPITPPLMAHRKSRSTVDGIVHSLSSLRSLPRAMTHSQVHDRTPLSRRESRVTVPYSRAGGSSVPGSPRSALSAKYPHQPHPFPMPGIFLAPPFPHHPHVHGHPHGLPHAHIHGSPAPMSTVDGSKLGTYESEWGAESRAVADRIVGFFGELSRLPWVSPRVSADYVPGGSQPEKNSASWYTISAPESPSVLSNVTQLVPEPWFPPAQAPPSTIVEQPEGEQQANEEDEESVKRKLERMEHELRERNEALQEMRRIVDYQKSQIGTLEEDLRKTAEQNVDRRRSSVRRLGDSLRVSRVSTRKTSLRVSSEY
ncbi:hypothetical protein EIP86_000924 [Pleurotus ostreatoroseus]|nr:hypothetical protein EIP86_000924 [Pleurotus ostreatoroseus]